MKAKAELQWECLGVWPGPVEGVKWRTPDGRFLINGSFKADGSPTFNVYEFNPDYRKEPKTAAWTMIEFGWTTLRRIMHWTDSYAKGKAVAI
jgi:hypothetical protein